MLWACILLPHLALDEIRRQRENYDEAAPFALVTGPAQRLQIFDANAAGQRAGVLPGQALAAARAIAGDFAHANYNADTEESLRRLLAAWAYGYSSMVSLREPGTLLVEIGASLTLFGPWPTFERRLRDDLSQLGISHHIVVATTPLAACALAHAHDGIAAISDAACRRAVAQLPLRALTPLGDVTVDALSSMGMTTVGQILALPRAPLARRFGPAVVDYLDRLGGIAPDPVELYQPPDRFAAHMEFDHEIETSTALLFPLRRLLGDLGAFLLGRDGGVLQFELVMEHDGRAATRLVVGMQEPQRDPASLFDIAKLRLQASTVAAPVRTLRVVANDLPPFVPASHDLFDARAGAGGSINWAQLAGRLRARLGESNLYSLEPTADPRPERSWRRVPRIDQRAELVVSPEPRPTWLFERPIPFHGTPRRILAGPERIESGWWDDGDVRFDFYVIETSVGQIAWAFRPAGATDGPWLLRGLFA